jgi:hypothetical protein
MNQVKRLSAMIAEGKVAEAGNEMARLLSLGMHPLRIVVDEIVPAINASGHDLEKGIIQATRLPAFRWALGTTLEQISRRLGGGLGLEFGIGRLRYDPFDLWRSVVRGAIEEVGFKTRECPDLIYCEITAVCGLAARALEKMRNDDGGAELSVEGKFGRCGLVSGRWASNEEPKLAFG